MLSVASLAQRPVAYGGSFMFRWTAFVLMLSLVGCSSALMPTAGQRQAIGHIAPAGGAFSATYSGTWTGDGSNCNARAEFEFSGKGSGSFIRHSTESGLFLNGDYGCGFGGTVRLTSKFNPANTIAAKLAPLRGDPPCTDSFIAFAITGGTGKFAHASGNGRWTLKCGNGTYTSTWAGTLNY